LLRYHNVSSPPKPPRRRRTANMNPVLCVPQRARPLFEGLRGLCSILLGNTLFEETIPVSVTFIKSQFVLTNNPLPYII